MAITPSAQVALSQIAKLCASGDCPAVFATERDTVVIQGYTWRDAARPVPPGESMVEIPSELLLIAAQGLAPSAVDRDGV